MLNGTRALAFLTITCASLALPACSDESTGPSEPTMMAKAIISEAFASRCETSIVMTSPTTMSFSSVCNMRGIGRVYGQSSQTLTFTAAGMGIENTTVYTTPAGDQLHASFSGHGTLNATFDAVTFTGTETYAGGTGRFTEATGSAILTGGADLRANTGNFTTSGSFRF